MYNLDQFTHKQIKRIFSRVYLCITWTNSPGYTSINFGKNVFNPYNSVTKLFFSFVLKIYLWGSPVRTHTFH